MTDSNSPNHWDALASSLGATPPAEEALRQPSPPSPAPSAPAVHKPESRHDRPAAPANWDALASKLGVTPTSEPVPPVVRSAAPVAPKPSASTPVAPKPAVAEESPNFFDERFDFDEPYDLLESVEKTSAEAKAVVAEEPAEQDEKRPRRRRRRRRGRGSRESAAAESSDVVAEDEQKDVTAESETVLEAEVVIQEASGEVDAQRSDEESEPRRPRGRRGRRGRRRREPAESSGESASEHVDKEKPSNDVAAEETSEASEMAEAVDLDASGELDGEEAPARVGFRGIPTWQETVGLLVDKNIEARARRPASPPHHGRGNRDSRGRGGSKRRS
ncbi:MAG: hypothetical protein ABFC77_00355 [Thermoguttaceae bacterium]